MSSLLNRSLVSRSERKRVMARKKDKVNDPCSSDDPEQLHMMDETNTNWVNEWKRTAKTRDKQAP